MADLKTKKIRKPFQRPIPLIDHVLNLISDLHSYPAHERRKIFQPSYYEFEGYMFLPRLPEADKIFNSSFISKWTNLLLHGPSERVFNESFNEFTEDRRQFRPHIDPAYTSQVMNPDMADPTRRRKNHILYIIQKSHSDIVLYPSFLYSFSNGKVQVPHSDLEKISSC